MATRKKKKKVIKPRREKISGMTSNQAAHLVSSMTGIDVCPDEIVKYKRKITKAVPMNGRTHRWDEDHCKEIAALLQANPIRRRLRG